MRDSCKAINVTALPPTPCDSLSPLSQPSKPRCYSADPRKKHHLKTQQHHPPYSPCFSLSETLSLPFPSSMALLKFTLLISLLLFLNLGSVVRAQIDETSLKLMSDALEWPTTVSLYDDLEGDDEEDIDGDFGRRSLFWHRMKYYISYGALSANRIPCPPRSGRSYYTHNCYQARGPVHPYTRGCSMITRCRR